jgi:hypothetical protein
VAAAGFAALAGADTLILRDGQRVEGELVGVRGGVIEFRERGFLGGGRVREYDRSDVRRIEIEDSGRGRDEFDPRGGNDGGARPRGLREREIRVAAEVPFTSTGVQVREGQSLYFEAEGKVRWGKDRQDDAGGEHGSHYNANRPIPNRPGGALIGRIGEGNDYFFIGNERGGTHMPGSGRLYLGINDDYLLDNSGSLRVIVYY